MSARVQDALSDLLPRVSAGHYQAKFREIPLCSAPGGGSYGLLVFRAGDNVHHACERLDQEGMMALDGNILTAVQRRMAPRCADPLCFYHYSHTLDAPKPAHRCSECGWVSFCNAACEAHAVDNGHKELCRVLRVRAPAPGPSLAPSPAASRTKAAPSPAPSPTPSPVKIIKPRLCQWESPASAPKRAALAPLNRQGKL